MSGYKYLWSNFHMLLTNWIKVHFKKKKNLDQDAISVSNKI